jgi:hypothetical protein
MGKIMQVIKSVNAELNGNIKNILQGRGNF